MVCLALEKRHRGSIDTASVLARSGRGRFEFQRPAESNKLRDVKKDAATPCTRVCLLWQHPLALAEFRRVLKDEPFDVSALRLEPGLSSSLQATLPGDASLFVVELDSGGAGEEIMPRLLSMGLSARTIILGEAFTEPTAFRLLRFGVKGIVTFAEASENLPRILREVIAGGFWVPRALLSRFVAATVAENVPRRPVGREPTLTPREREVLEELLKNLSNKEIAKNLRISGRTAKFHVSNVMAKYGVKRRADLLLLFSRSADFILIPTRRGGSARRASGRKSARAIRMSSGVPLTASFLEGTERCRPPSREGRGADFR